MKEGVTSIVIPTHNRLKMLNALLISIEEHCRDLIYEVVIVDDSDESQKIPALKGIKRIKHIKLDKRVYISKAKNLGWKNTESEFVWFIDDDNIIDGSTFKPIEDLIKRREDIGAIMPAVLYKREPNLVWVYATPLRKDGWGFYLLGRNKYRNPFFENRIIRTDALPNSSIAKRSVLEEVGGFNERLPVNSSAELCLKIKRKGLKTVSCTSSFIFHDVEPPGKIGWWASHGVTDPDRVRYEVADWFRLMKLLHGQEKAFVIKAFMRSLGFLAPNALAYITRGNVQRLSLIRNQFHGLIEGMFNIDG